MGVASKTGGSTKAWTIGESISRTIVSLRLSIVITCPCRSLYLNLLFMSSQTNHKLNFSLLLFQQDKFSFSIINLLKPRLITIISLFCPKDSSFDLQIIFLDLKMIFSDLKMIFSDLQMILDPQEELVSSGKTFFEFRRELFSCFFTFLFGGEN